MSETLTPAMSHTEHRAAHAAPPPAEVEDDKSRRGKATTAHRLAGLLDDAFTIPGTRLRFGLDGLLGLIPGVGDILGAAFSSFIIALAARAGAPRAVLARMAGNVAIETLVGAIPLIGDLFDFAWKANRRNVELLDRALQNPEKTARRSTGWIIAVFAGILLLAGGIIAAIYGLIALFATAVT
ncbi:MAG: DUF4112 domain-containing protein [bacterium]